MTADQKAKNILLDKTCDTCIGCKNEKEGETCLKWKVYDSVQEILLALEVNIKGEKVAMETLTVSADCLIND